MLIDSHCHLTFDKLVETAGDVDGVVTAARQAGVTGMMTICCHPAKEWEQTRAIVDRHKDVWCSYGVHPHGAADPQDSLLTADDLATNALAHPKIVALGECGLDYFYEYAPRDAQWTMFERHVAAGIKADLPLVIHSRDAEDDTLAVLRAGGGKSRGIIHCFSSGEKLARGALDIGYYISFSGIVTFKKCQELRDIAAWVPMDRILVETDSPYLAPEPFRGRTNQPAFVTETARVLANIKGVPYESFCEQTTRNFFDVCSRAVPA